MIVVVDTNVLLDFWVFDDPRARAARDALIEGRLAAVRCEECDDEFARVLERPRIDLRIRANSGDVTAERIKQRWRALARHCGPLRASPWRCRDAGDQKFLDLAHTAGAELLLTKDRALLDLGRRTGRGGQRALRISTPDDCVASMRLEDRGA